MTHEEYMNMEPVSLSDGKILDGTALAEYHYRLKTQIIDNLVNTMPHSIIISPDSYEALGNTTVTIKGFTTFPKNSNYIYKLIINDEEKGTITIEPTNRFTVDFPSIIGDTIKDLKVKVRLLGTDEETAPESNIAIVKVFPSIKTLVYSNSATPETIQGQLGNAKDMPARNNYKGQVNFKKDASITFPYTYYIFMPKCLNAPSTINGSTFAKFDKITEKGIYDIYKLDATISVSEDSFTIQ